jgi:putative hydrolase of the HAD superfamily
MPPFKLIFDLDDTLYPERAYALGGFRAAAAWASEALAVPDLTARLTELLDAGHLGRSFAIALAEAKPDHDADHLKAMLRAYATHTPDLALFPDAAACLDHFAGATLGLVTNGHPATQARKVAALGIAGRFAEIVYAGALGPNGQYHKPHPRPFETIENALRRDPGDRFVYVGDNPEKDFAAPNKMGWITILIDRPSHRATRIHPLTTPPAGAAPHATITALTDLPDVLAPLRL